MNHSSFCSNTNFTTMPGTAQTALPSAFFRAEGFDNCARALNIFTDFPHAKRVVQTEQRDGFSLRAERTEKRRAVRRQRQKKRSDFLRGLGGFLPQQAAQ